MTQIAQSRPPITINETAHMLGIDRSRARDLGRPGSAWALESSSPCYRVSQIPRRRELLDPEPNRHLASDHHQEADCG